MLIKTHLPKINYYFIELYSFFLYIGTMDITRAEQIANEKMIEHGLTGWSFGFDDSVRRRGCCHWSRKEITLSRALTELRDEAWVVNTILHEIAHALCGPHEGHSSVWREKAISIGCNGERCSSDGVAIPKTFRCECPNCGSGWSAHRRSKVACGKCCKQFNGGKWTRKYQVKWTRI